jgi:hypothetical protein
MYFIRESFLSQEKANKGKKIGNKGKKKGDNQKQRFSNTGKTSGGKTGTSNRQKTKGREVA